MSALPSCEGSTCTTPITHITAKGYVTCTAHAPKRGTYSEGSRALRAWELDLLREGKPVPSYRPISYAEYLARAAKARLEYLRAELRAERMSWGELHELQSLAAHIDAGDIELLEAAGVPELDDEVSA